MLEAVRIDDPDRVAKLYPHEVSGGMGQRVMIAMMLIPEPDLLIADEPTSALDVSVQAQVLDIIDELVRRTGMGLIFISHDLNLVSSYCDRILVMRGGEVVEECAAGQLGNATHPYTRGPARSDPAHRRDARRTAGARPQRMGGMSAISIDNLDVSYGESRITHGIGFDVADGESFALVGESGSGKTTVLKAIAGLARQWSGTIAVFGKPRSARHRPRLRAGSARWCSRTRTDRCIRARPSTPH